MPASYFVKHDWSSERWWSRKFWVLPEQRQLWLQQAAIRPPSREWKLAHFETFMVKLGGAWNAATPLPVGSWTPTLLSYKTFQRRRCENNEPILLILQTRTGKWNSKTPSMVWSTSFWFCPYITVDIMCAIQIMNHEPKIAHVTLTIHSCWKPCCAMVVEAHRTQGYLSHV